MKQLAQSFGPFTYPGLYQEYFRSLPGEPRALGELLSHQIIHRVTLAQGNAYANADQRYGDMTRWPWHRSACQDDIYLTAPAIAAGIFRLDERGFVPGRAVEHKLVLTCRFVAVLAAAIFKAKGLPCRCRAGFAPYCRPGASVDHWINQLWLEEEGRWLTFDADGLYDGLGLPVTQYDMKPEEFNWAGDVWLAIRRGETDGDQFVYSDCLGTCGLRAAARYLVYDLCALMNFEVSYVFAPRFLAPFLNRETEAIPPALLEKMDALARLLQNPDENGPALQAFWEEEREFRDMVSPLVG